MINDNFPNEEIEFCEVPRWQRIKSTLNNLNFSSFVKAAHEDEKSVIIDVRTSAEFDNAGRIEGAVNLDYLSKHLADEIEALNPDLHYYVYCRTGRRSLRVCVIMRNLGFKTIFNLEGGIATT